MRKSRILCLGITVILFLSACGTHDSSSVITPTAAIHTESDVTPAQSEPAVTPKAEKSESNCRLVVNGKDITSENYVMLTQDDVYLPFTAILEALGAELLWQSDTTAKISFDGKKYLLTTTDCSLIEEGGDFNFLLIPPGGIHRYWTIENEFIVDDTMMQSVFILMEKDIRVRFSSKEKVVNIFRVSGKTPNNTADKLSQYIKNHFRECRIKYNDKK